MNYKFPTTLEEYINEHRKMWTWIAEETLRQKKKVSKYDYLSKYNIYNILDGNCWMCEYAYKKTKGNCDNCPLQWLDIDGIEISYCCESPCSLFRAWIKEDDYQKAYELAYKIANLKVKKEELL